MQKRADLAAAIAERRDFLIRHHIALWDVLASCEIKGAADASIRSATPNDFTKIFASSLPTLSAPCQPWLRFFRCDRQAALRV